MGKKYRFRLSDMMPNTWFYKLKDMGQRASKNQTSAQGRSQQRPSRSPAAAAMPSQAKLLPGRGSLYHSSRAESDRLSFSPTHRRTAPDAHFPVEPPRKSKKSSRRKPVVGAPAKPRSVTSPVAAGCSCHSCKESVPEFPPVVSPETPFCQRDYYVDYEEFASWTRSCRCRVTSSAATDIIVDINANTPSAPKVEQLNESDSVSELSLAPIITKPAAKEAEFEDKNVVEKEQGKSQARRVSSPALRRLRMRANSPRIPSNKKVQAPRGRRTTAAAALQRKGGLSASLAVVKASSDPQRDFKESMMEMIVENNIRASKDLEELLACYLSLNSNEYHGAIVKAFEQIWFHLTHIEI
ncbi:hypothetical protein Cni_G13569 [Canna indica]|uniref:Transcription repressor n=1 Tax=Canna indica TaxID=4628 RepID=A0AAQ3KEC3_9LILI|nr:hypothetical protein Cni_G13569 [Canna indica]